MDEATERATVCLLVTEACALVERAERSVTGDEHVAVEAAVLRAELDAQVAYLTDEELAGDVAAAAAELDALLARLDELPAPAAALTG